MVTQHLDGLPVRNPIDILQDTHASISTGSRACARSPDNSTFPRWGAPPPSAGKPVGKEGVAVVWGEETGG